MENGKRDADEIIEEEVVIGKKQKIENGGVEEEHMDGAVEAKDEDGPRDNPTKEDAVEPASKVEEGCNDDDKGSEEEKDGPGDGDEPETTNTTDDSPSAKNAPETPAKETRTLFLGNLSFSVKEDDLVNFFKDAGEVHEVRLAFRDGRFAGYGHVEFVTPDAAQKALKLNGELLLDRAVRIDLANERRAPNNGDSQKSGQSQALTVFVKGFGTDEGYDDVKINLEELFGECGEISRIGLPKAESGDLKGVAYIDFTDRDALSKALDLTGTEIGGGTIIVEEAKRGGGGGSGRGRGGGRGGRGGGRGGRGGRRGRGRGRGRR